MPERDFRLFWSFLCKPDGIILPAADEPSRASDRESGEAGESEEGLGRDAGVDEPSR